MLWEGAPSTEMDLTSSQDSSWGQGLNENMLWKIKSLLFLQLPSDSKSDRCSRPKPGLEGMASIFETEPLTEGPDLAETELSGKKRMKVNTTTSCVLHSRGPQHPQC